MHCGIRNAKSISTTSDAVSALQTVLQERLISVFPVKKTPMEEDGEKFLLVLKVLKCQEHFATLLVSLVIMPMVQFAGKTVQLVNTHAELFALIPQINALQWYS